MFVKCDTKSKRVKCVCFHPTLQWFLASLHNGDILLWDYSTKVLIEKFSEHQAPVRAVHFHHSQPLFVSGADDYSIKVWNYSIKKCLFTLLGHIDYVRSVQFHHNYPWILSSSDDQTVRIWNWQNRSCIAVLAGHNHYVMYAQFNPTQDLIISASLDQTLRIWDISGLVRKQTGGQLDVSINNILSISTDVFAPSDAICKFVIEAHERGINFVCFHPTLPLFASAADDRLIKLWRFNEVSFWEVDTFRGHFDNVSSVIFHPLREILISNSEDRTIRIWDINKRTLLHTYRRDGDRFWTLASACNSNILAAGHDSGTLIFKLCRERPAHDLGFKKVFYVSDGFVNMTDEIRGQNTQIVGCRKLINALSNPPYCLHYNVHNSFNTEILLGFKESSGKFFDFISVSHTEDQQLNLSKITTKQVKVCLKIRYYQIVGSSAAFISYNRFALLDAPKGILLIFNTACVLNRKIELPVPTDKIFSGGLNRLILESGEKLYLYNVSQKEIIASLHISENVRYVIWSSNFTSVALLSKHYITIASQMLEQKTTIHENLRIKSGAWDSHEAFLYFVSSHIKYCLLNGDQGVIKSLPKPLYIFSVSDDTVRGYSTETNNFTTLKIKTAEYKLKIALNNKNYHEVAKIIKQGGLCGNVIVDYLRNQNYSEIALHFADDPIIRHNLYLECGLAKKALEVALEIPDEVNWDNLALQATRLGEIEVTEKVYQKTENINENAFLYLISGNIDKLQNLLTKEIEKDNFQNSYLYALFVGDAEKRVRILANSGKVSLALLTARTYKLNHLIDELEKTREGEVMEAVVGEPLIPAKPIYVHPSLNWNKADPEVSKFLLSFKDLTEVKLPKEGEASIYIYGMIVERPDETLNGNSDSEIYENPILDIDDTWEDIENVSNIEGRTVASNYHHTDSKKLSIPFTDISDDEEEEENIQPGNPIQSFWGNENACPAKLLAAGCYTECLKKLVSNIGLENATPLLPILQKFTYSSSTYFPLMPLLKSKVVQLLDNGNLADLGTPVQIVTVESISEILKSAHKLIAEGKFAEAQKEYSSVIHHIPFVDTSLSLNEKTSQELNTMLETAALYALATRIELERLDLKENQTQRNVELAAYLGSLKLKGAHRYFMYRRAMAVAWKANNFLTAATFARHIIQEYDTPKLADAIANTRKMLSIAEKHKSDAYMIDFDQSDIEKTQICSTSLTRILPGENVAKCPFCRSKSKTIYTETICSICWVAGLK